MKRAIVLAGLIVTAGCTVEVDEADTVSEELGVDEEGITDGTTDNGHWAVGTINSNCSATLIGTRHVLTAAHCVSGLTPAQVTFTRWGSFSQSPYEAYFYGAETVTVHPSYTSGSITNDVALVKTTAAVNTTPLPISTSQTAANFTIVGFGTTETEETNFGIRRSAAATRYWLTTTNFLFYDTPSTGQLCFGDSGGASLAFLGSPATEALIGVHSFGSVPCGEWDWDVRVDAKSKWIVQIAKRDVATIRWQNPNRRWDTNGDGVESSNDALVIGNELNAYGQHVLPAPRAANAYFYDVNGDGWVTQMDYLQVTNCLNDPQTYCPPSP